MRISPILFGVLVLVIFLGTIFGFQAAGIWSISGKTNNGQAVQPSKEDVETIKGWMTLEQISTVYSVPLADLLLKFDLPADTPSSTAIKDLESEEFSVTNLRTWLESRMETIDAEMAPTSIPQVTASPAFQPTNTIATPLPIQHVVTEKYITGKTTFQDLLDWGIPAETIINIIGEDLPDKTIVIKDYVTQKGMEFAPIKSALQAEVDKTK